MLKNTLLFICCDPEIVVLLCFVCQDPEIKFLYLCPFFVYLNMSFRGNQIGDIVPILLVGNVLLTFKIEQN